MSQKENIKDNLERVKSETPVGVKLVAVSKTKPNEDIMAAYEGGQKVFGENKVQELVPKHEAMPKDIEWHMIGHLQRNKVKYIAPFVNLIHGVDSFKLLREINKEAIKNNRVIDCLLQFHIAKEESKFGFELGEAEEMIDSDGFKELKNIRLVGVMGMATYTEDENQVRKEFSELKNLFDQLKEKYFPTSDSFSEISMGMSSDYKLAIQEGSTIIRVGSSIFGERHYL